MMSEKIKSNQCFEDCFHEFRDDSYFANGLVWWSSKSSIKLWSFINSVKFLKLVETQEKVHQTACKYYLEIFICQTYGKNDDQSLNLLKANSIDIVYLAALRGHKLLFEDRIFKFQAQKMNNTIAEHNDDLMK